MVAEIFLSVWYVNNLKVWRFWKHLAVDIMTPRMTLSDVILILIRPVSC